MDKQTGSMHLLRITTKVKNTEKVNDKADLQSQVLPHSNPSYPSTLSGNHRLDSPASKVDTGLDFFHGFGSRSEQIVISPGDESHTKGRVFHLPLGVGGNDCITYGLYVA